MSKICYWYQGAFGQHKHKIQLPILDNITYYLKLLAPLGNLIKSNTLSLNMLDCCWIQTYDNWATINEQMNRIVCRISWQFISIVFMFSFTFRILPSRLIKIKQSGILLVKNLMVNVLQQIKKMESWIVSKTLVL